MTTLTDFKTQVAQKLRILASGENLDPDDGALIETYYTQVHAQLYKDGLLTWSISQAIPDLLTIPMVTIVAAHLTDEFQLPPQFANQLKAEGALGNMPLSWGERRLRQLLAKKFIHEPIGTEYF